MNTFFYAARASSSSKHYLKQLQKLSSLQNLTIIPEGSGFTTPLALKLRSGDLLLLFASNTQDLDMLLDLQDELDEFRIILTLTVSDHKTIKRAQLLRPSFIAFQDNNMREIEAIIIKIAQL